MPTMTPKALANAIPLALLSAGALALTSPAAAQDEETIWPANAEAVDYAGLAALPDWRGMWLPNGRSTLDGGEEPVLTDEYRHRYEAYQAAVARGENPELNERTSNCLPPGMPSVMTQPYNVMFLFTPGKVTVLQEAYMQVRTIFTDGRPLPEDPDPAFNGHSVGRWEGDTLVVETVGVKEGTRLGRIGITHGPNLKITERIHQDEADPDLLHVEFTFEDPDALAAPWRQAYSYRRNRAWEQIEFVCVENDRNPIGEDGITDYQLNSAE
jgi:hypothetical protein